MIIIGKTKIYILGNALGSNGIDEIIELKKSLKKAKKKRKKEKANQTPGPETESQPQSN